MKKVIGLFVVMLIGVMLFAFQADAYAQDDQAGFQMDNVPIIEPIQPDRVPCPPERDPSPAPPPLDPTQADAALAMEQCSNLIEQPVDPDPPEDPIQPPPLDPTSLD